LVGDYTGCLHALEPLSTTLHVQDEGKTLSANQVVTTVFAARVSQAYHAGVSYLMLRRYKDAIRTLGEICSLHGFKTGQLRKDQMGKMYDRMIALLAILTHICPGATGRGSSSSSSSSSLLEDSVLRTIRDKHGSTLSKIDAGEEGYEDLFMYACPKFVLSAIPDYSKPSSKNGSPKDNAYKQQVTKFQTEMMSQHSTRKLRSYMKLYTSIDVVKLASFHDATEQQATAESQFLPTLIAYKHKMKQLECTTGASSESDNTTTSTTTKSLVQGQIGSALDIHYYITTNNSGSGSMVHVDEAEKQRRFENFFMGQIQQNIDILKDVETLSTRVNNYSYHAMPYAPRNSKKVVSGRR
jgi:translation initiation factor 3 subunit L